MSRGGRFFHISPSSPVLSDPQYSVLHYHAVRVHNGKRNVTVWRPSICPVGILTTTHQGAACNAVCIHFGPVIRRTDVLVFCG